MPGDANSDLQISVPVAQSGYISGSELGIDLFRPGSSIEALDGSTWNTGVVAGDTGALIETVVGTFRVTC